MWGLFRAWRGINSLSDLCIVWSPYITFVVVQYIPKSTNNVLCWGATVLYHLMNSNVNISIYAKIINQIWEICATPVEIKKQLGWSWRKMMPQYKTSHQNTSEHFEFIKDFKIVGAFWQRFGSPTNRTSSHYCSSARLGTRLSKAYGVTMQRYRNLHAIIQDSKIHILRCMGSKFCVKF